MSENNKIEKCVFIGKKYFFGQGKYSINPKSVGLPVCLITFIYNFIHSSFIMHKLIYNNSTFFIILIINIVLFSLQIFQTLFTALTDPGSFLPNYGEDKSNSADSKIMIATINGQDYFLKFCRTCLNAKDLRVYHCDDCGLCILRHDHHCPWLSTCIGLNNHRHFIILLIVNLIFFIYNTSILMSLIFIRFDKQGLNELTMVENLFLFFLVVLNGVLLLFHIALLINHSIYICTGQTTSEKVRRKPRAKNPYKKEKATQNCLEFWKYPMKYRERIEYNDKASKFLDTNILICDYLSGNYYLSPEKKVVSVTYMNKGYRYDKATIELIDKSNQSNEEETKENLKLDEQDNNSNEASLNEQTE